ncbi:MAG: NIPSNAP family protein [Ferruginibacter sp.]|nr:NIPSNAP family protein [Chitinophagaceae bacterium]
MHKMTAKILFLVFFIVPVFSIAQQEKTTGEFYQLTVYHYSNAEQQQLIEQYLQVAYVPALHRQQIKKVGIFTPIANDTATDKRLYLLIPVKSLQQVAELTATLVKDNDYQAKGKSYLDAAYKSPPYNRLENILLQSFPLAPFLNLPKLTGPVAERIYELRSYESATEKIFQNKVQMFNEGGEIALFKRLNFNAIFYASVIAGGRMPNLMYMTSFENKTERDAHWKNFSADPDWKKLSAMPEYQNNVSKIDIVFMRATAYSDY